MTDTAALFVPQLPLARVRRDQPALRGRPLMLWAQRGQTAVVTATDDLRLVGLSLARAERLCPDADCLPADPAADRACIVAISRALGALSPRVTYHDEADGTLWLCDLGRVAPAHAPALAERCLQAALRASGLRPRVGLAPSMTVARLAARVAPPGGALVVAEGEVEAFLAPVPLSLLPIEPDVVERLHWLGVQTIGALAQLPSAALQQQFGACGTRLHLLAQGVDPPPARVPRTPDLPVIRVGWRFPGATADRMVLEAALARIAGRLAMRLEAAGWSARALTLLLEHEDGVISAARSLEHPTSDIRILRRLFTALANEHAIPAPVERVYVEVTPAPRQVHQATMFDDTTGDSLDDLVARLAGRHGAALLRAEVCEAATSGCFEQQARVLPWEDAV